MGGIDDFRSYLGLRQIEIAVMITHAEVEDVIWYSDRFRAQSWKCDSVIHGDCLSVSRNVFVKVMEGGGAHYDSLVFLFLVGRLVHFGGFSPIMVWRS